ncbi:hypothetical protein SPURM210S_05830 [Streptomyces purpurascens]
MVNHRPVAARTTLVLGTAWITAMTLGVQVGSVPFATKGNAEFLGNRVEQVRAGLKDARVFQKQAAVDAFAKTPPDQLLTGLRGKDVLFTFIESYGRVAIDDPAMAPQIDSVLKEGTSSLKAAGFESRSGWLQSPVTGAGSWLAHSTFLSGLWIKNQQRYRSLTTSDRMTLTNYFGKTNAWRTVGVVPGVRRAWPEGKYFGLDHIYDSEHLGYHGPYFSWTPVPDQFSMEAFQRLEHGKKDREPIMAEIILASSHNPWSPIARMIDWEDLGDGSVFHQIKKEGTNPTEVWKDPEKVRTEYRHAIEYSLRSLTEWIERYGDEDTVLVFLGDHQPVPTVTAGDTGKDVPITIVAKDKKVLDRVADWGWTDGLKPAENAPRWGMDKFRDRFMTAYGPQGSRNSSTSARNSSGLASCTRCPASMAGAGPREAVRRERRSAPWDRTGRPTTDQQRGHGDPPHVVPPHRIRRVALPVGGENHRPVVRQVPAGTFGERARRVQGERRGYVLQHQALYEVRTVLGEQVGDGAAERVAHDVGAGDTEGTEEGVHIVAHRLVGVVAGPVTAAVPAQVRGVDPAGPGGQCRGDPGPVGTVGPAGVEEQDGRRVLRSPGAVGQGDAVRLYSARFCVHAGHRSGGCSGRGAGSADSRRRPHSGPEEPEKKAVARRTNHSGSSSHG